MRSRIQPWFAIVLVFMAIGIAARMLQGSIESWLIPLVLVTIVFVLYKFPPSSWRGSAQRGRSAHHRQRPDPKRTSAKSERRRTSTFTVIEGRKNKEDDETPPYH